MDDLSSKYDLDSYKVTVKVEESPNEVDVSDGHNVIKSEDMHIKEETDTNKKTRIDAEYNILHPSIDIKTDLDNTENIATYFQDHRDKSDLWGTVKTEKTEDTVILKSETIELGLESDQKGKRVTIKMADCVDEVGCDDESNELYIFQTVKSDVDVKLDINVAKINTEEINVEAEATRYGKKSKSCDNQINRTTRVRKRPGAKHCCVPTGYKNKAFVSERSNERILGKLSKRNHDMEGEVYQCNICDFRTKYKQTLRQHFTTKHDEEADWYQCHACDYRTKFMKQLKQHFTVKHDKKAEWYQCVFCNYKTKLKMTLKHHFMMTHDETAELYKCQSCDFKTKNRTSLKRHNAIKHDKKTEWYHCVVCNFKTKHKNHLKQHSTRKHYETAEWYQCTVCDFKTRHQTNLKRHFTLKHDDEAVFHQCSACHYKTKLKKDLERHFITKHDEEAKWYQCQACMFKTKIRSYLRLHFKVKHDEKAEWYQCLVCDYKTKHKAVLRRHFTGKHGNKAAASVKTVKNELHIE